MLKHTSLYSEHVAAGAHLVDFSGWEMPLHYGSQIEEHHQVRHHVGLFDVSHMGVVELQGKGATDYLRHLLANDVARLKQPQSALYTCLLNENGGVRDDLIVYRLSDTTYRLVINAAMREKDFSWFEAHRRAYEIELKQRPELSIIAIQGPKFDCLLPRLFDVSVAEKIKALRPFRFILCGNLWIARTGYTGEDGIEVILPNSEAAAFWRKCVEQGAKPCGLGARDTLRLEAGFNLYGVDMDESTTPLESNLSWTVSWNDAHREFIGREALKAQIAFGLSTQLVGLIMEEPGVLRNHQIVYFDGTSETGEITSGSFSPTLGYAIAFARIPTNYRGQPCVERRGKRIPVKIVSLPFVHRAKVKDESAIQSSELLQKI